MFVFVLSFGIHREPPFLHTRLLLKYLEDTPEARTADDTQDGTQDGIGNQQTASNKEDSKQGKHPPTASTKVILTLDDNGMERADNQKGGRSQYNTRIIHDD